MVMLMTETEPAKSRTSTILDFLASAPDTEWRAFEIAAAIGDKTQPVANECGRLARTGRLTRVGDPADRTTHTFYRARVGGQ